MHYEDLSCYRIGGPTRFSIYPNVMNVGWLSENEPFQQGNVPDSISDKLKLMLFLDQEQAIPSGNSPCPINLHTMQVRGPAHECPFCKSTIVERNADSTAEIELGCCEIWIPSVTPKEFFATPSLLYHYVVKHNYLPPDRFLRSVESFDLQQPFDIDNALNYVREITNVSQNHLAKYARPE